MTLKKFTLDFNDDKEKWVLKKDKSDEVVKSFSTKEEATKGGVLKKALGPDGGSVKIKTRDEKYQEERTYPAKLDPKKSKG